MPRRHEVSFELKLIIWDKASTTGKKPEVIQRELDDELRRLRKAEYLFEEVPDVRTIKRIIEKDINGLNPEVVLAKLPRYVWHLRNDCKAVEALAETTLRKSPLPEDQVTAVLIIASNLEKIRNAPPQSLGDPLGRTIYTVEEKIYGGWWVYEDRAKLGDVDKAVAATLLKSLKEEGEFPELVDIDDWKDLRESLVSEEFIQRLISRAHRGN